MAMEVCGSGASDFSLKLRHSLSLLSCFRRTENQGLALRDFYSEPRPPRRTPKDSLPVAWGTIEWFHHSTHGDSPMGA